MLASSRQVVGIVILVGGAVGGGLALYDATIKKNDVIDNAASAFASAGLPGELRDYFSFSLGIGIWLCIAGGVVAIVAGIMAMMSRQAPVAMAGDPAGFDRHHRRRSRWRVRRRRRLDRDARGGGYHAERRSHARPRRRAPRPRRTNRHP